MAKYKIGDFEKRGNVVRFYLVEDDCNDYWGDDWDDTPYEHNAGTIYEEYVKKVIDIAFPLGYAVLEPSDSFSNSPFSKESFKNRRVPCIIVAKSDDVFYNDYMNAFAQQDFVCEFYFNDGENRITDCEYGYILGSSAQDEMI